MPQVLHEDENSTTILDDAGNVAVIPRGMMGGGAPAPAAPGAYDHIAGLVGQVNGAPAPAAIGMGPGGAPGVGDLQQAGIAPPIAPAPGFTLPPRGGPMGTGVEPDLTAPPPMPPRAPAAGPGSAPGAPPAARPAPAPAPGSEAAFAQNEAQYGMAVTDEQKAVQDQARIEAEQSAQQADLLQKRNDELDRQNEAAQAKRDREAAQLDDLRGKHDTAIKEWASAKVDDSHFYKSRSTGQEIAMAISLALSGIGEALQGRGGRNPALDLINKYAENDVNAQIRERDNLRDKATMAGSAVDRFRGLMGDNESARQALLAATKERAANQIEQAAKAYGSPAALARGEQAAAQLRASAAEHSAQATQGVWQRGQAQRSLDEQIASRKASTGLGYANLKQSNQHFYASLADKAIDRATGLAMDAAKLGAGERAAQGKAAQDQQKEIAARAIGGAPRLATDDQGAPIVDRSGAPQVTYEPLKQADGSVFLPDEKSAPKLRDMKASADVINQFIGGIKRGIAEHGGESGYFQSADWQRTKSASAGVTLEMKNAYQLGALSESDVKLVEGLLGSTDPTSFVHDATAGLEAARQGINSKLNSTLRAYGYTGGEYAPTDPASGTPRQRTAADQGTHELLTRVPGSGYLTGKDADTAAQIATAIGMPSSEIAAAQRGYDEDQAALVANQANIASSPSAPAEAKADALRILETVGTSATSPQLKALARDTLARVQNGTWQQVEAHDPTMKAAAEAARRVRELATGRVEFH